MTFRLVGALRSAAIVLVVACGGNTGTGAGPAVPGNTSTACGRAEPEATVAPSAPAQIECGGDHSCVLMGDGSVKCWGRNNEGQLGDGTTETRASPVTVRGLGKATQVTLGDHFSCALLANKTVACWGSGSTAPPKPVPGLADVVEIDGGGVMACARLASGKVTCWGGKEIDAMDVPSGAVQISVAEAHGCARLVDGSIACWGDTVWGGPFKHPAVKNAVDVSAGDSFACAVVAGGGVSCWGRNDVGQLGAGKMDADDHADPVAVAGIACASQVMAGGGHACALVGDGSARCWGANSSGELCRGTTSDEPQPSAPVQGVAGIVEISLGNDHGCARTRDGAIYCWGSNAQAQLGDGTRQSRSTAARVSL